MFVNENRQAFTERQELNREILVLERALAIDTTISTFQNRQTHAHNICISI